MLKRLVPLFVLVALIGTSTPATMAQVQDPQFDIVSITYMDANNKEQTVKLKAGPIAELAADGKTQLPAVAVQNKIIIKGTYTPANALICGTIHVYKGETSVAKADPKVSNGAWTATIPANTLAIKTEYAVHVDVNGGDPDTARMGPPGGGPGLKVAVTRRKFFFP